MKILIAAGGSGGHIFPAVRLAEEILFRGNREVIFICSSRPQDRRILSGKNITFKTLPIIGMQSKGALAILNFSLRLIAGTLKSVYLLVRYRPSTVVGFGGYVSGPIVLLAALSGIKTVIHEQNVYPGKTNMILARFVHRVALNFPESVKYLKRYKSKIVISGNPLRKELKKNRKEKNLFTVLTMGGSQGAHRLNMLIPKAMELIGEDRKKNIEAVHITGYKDKDEVATAYQDIGIKNKVYSFTEEMGRLYNECDFVISRAGATTVSELLYFKKPSILIPYPYGDGHQALNAAVLEKRGIGIILDEGSLTARSLCETIVRFMDKDMLSAIEKKSGLSKDIKPCDILIEEIVK